MKRWPTKPLEELVTDLQPGFACRPSERGTETPQIRPLNLTELGTMTLDGTKSVECSALQTSRYSLLPSDVLFNNTNSPELVGKVAVFRESGRFVFSNHITRIRVRRDRLLPEFLHRFLFKAWSDGFFQHHCTQWINQAAINVDALAKVTVPVPPLTEQGRIVKLLDEADELRKLRAQADRRAADLISALFHNMFGDPTTNPKGWPLTRAGELTEFITSGSRGWAEYYSDKGAKFIRVQNLTRHRLSFDDVAFVCPPRSAESKRTRVQPNNLLVTITGVVGLVAIAPGDIGDAHVSQHVAIVRLSDQINSTFAQAFLADPSGGQRQIAEMQYGQTKPGLNLNQIRSIQIFLPPHTLQREFAARVSEIRALQADQAASRRRVDDLFQSMLHRAFQGEL